MENYIEQINNIIKLMKTINNEDIINLCNKIDMKNNKCGIVGNNILNNNDLLMLLKDNTRKMIFEEINDNDFIKYDVIIQVLDAVQPLSRGDIELYKQVVKYCNNIIFIVKRLELVDEDDIDDLIEYIEDKLSKITNMKQLYIYSCSKSMDNLIDVMNNSNDIKGESINNKLSFIIDIAVDTIKNKIDIIENSDKYNVLRKLNIEKEIESLEYFAEGLAMFIYELVFKIENSEYSIESSFCEEFTSGIKLVIDKYLNISEYDISKLKLSYSNDKKIIINGIIEIKKYIMEKILDIIECKRYEMINDKNNSKDSLSLEAYKEILLQLSKIKGNM